jgi:heterodisulfide reductase subunit B
MKLSYYPGCSLEGTALDYDKSVRAVCAKLAIDLVEIPDWNCCGASSAHMTDHESGMRLPIRNLLQATGAGLDILVPCAACFQRLKAADKALRADPTFWDVKEYQPAFSILHISTFLARPEILAALTSKIVRDLEGLAVACYYGCLSLRNPRITDAPDYERPNTLERIVWALGARPLSWSHKTECCSGSLTMARPDIAEKLVGDIVDAAVRAGATAMVTDCPMCQANVESRQRAAMGAPAMPVFFITELLDAALTGSYPQHQHKTHLVAPSVLAEIFAAAAMKKEGAL